MKSHHRLTLVKKISITSASLFITFQLSGCEVLLIGGAAAGGYYVGEDEPPAAVVAADSLVTSSVKTALFKDPDIKALNIDVDTYKGAVTLTGHVTEASLIKRATKLAQSQEGVQSVKSRLIVLPAKK